MAEQEKKQCPNCGKKDSLWNKVNFLSQKDTDFINRYHEPKQAAYCENDNCGYMYMNTYRNTWDTDKYDLISELKEISLDVITVISLPNPQGWQFDIIDLVTAQTTTGTGAITEIFSQVADLMGEQSNRHNDKIQTAVNMCKRQLRSQAIQLGGNAVIGCNVEITTGGTGNGLIIVCMSGTVVKVKNTEVFRGDAQKEIDKILELQSKISEMNKYKYSE